MGTGTEVRSSSFLDGRNPLSQEICLFLAQLAVIICVSKTIAFFLKKIKQPAVIAEVIGGILLGPTAFGRIPGFTDTLFPQESLPMLKLMAEFGLLLFLFLIGMELDPTKLGSSLKKCAAISVSGIVVPFGLSMAISKILYDKYTDPSVSFVTFALFCGVAMSITAFPVLARIMTEQNLLHTEVGQIALASGMVEDGIAWCLLILVIALVNNPANAINALYAFFIIAAFGIFLWLAVRPLLIRLINEDETSNVASQFNVFVVFMVMIISAFFTQAVGADVIFGAFLVGLIIPHNNGFAIAMTEKIEDLVTILFLPLYFAYAGLGVNLTFLNDGEIWGYVFLVILCACTGKIAGCAGAARITGTPNRESLTIGLLMNTKGLVELIVLNIGKNAGVLSDKTYAIFLVMALVTTFMTVPLVSLVFPPKYHAASNQALRGEKDDSLVSGEKFNTLKLLVCLPNMKIVPGMMNVSRMLFQSVQKLDLFALRLIELGERQSKVMMASETMSTMAADPVLNIFKTFSQVNNHSLKSLFAVAAKSNFIEEIHMASSTLSSNIIIFPIEHSPNTYPKGWAQKLSIEIFETNTCTVAFFIDRGFGLATGNDNDDNFAKFRDQESVQIKVALSQFSADRSALQPSSSQSTVDIPDVNIRKQTLFFAFCGTVDDIEVCVLLNYLAHYPAVLIKILVLNDIEVGSEFETSLNTLKSFPSVTIEKDLFGDIIKSASELGAKDLVLVSHSKFVSDFVLQNWLDNECKSSFCIIKAPVKGFKKIVVQA